MSAMLTLDPHQSLRSRQMVNHGSAIWCKRRRRRVSLATRKVLPSPLVGEVKRACRVRDYVSITPRRGDGVQLAVAEYMRHEAWGLEYFCERRVADVQAAGIGAE